MGRRSLRAVVGVALLVGSLAGSAAAGPSTDHPGVTEVATNSFPVFGSFAADEARWLFAGDQGSGPQHAWTVDLSAGGPPVRIGPDLTGTTFSVTNVLAVDGQAVYKRSDSSDMSSVLLTAPDDASADPVPLQGIVPLGSQVPTFGRVADGVSVWWTRNAGPGTPTRLYVRRADRTDGSRRLSPPTADGVGDVVSVPGGAHLLWTGKVDTSQVELWSTPVAGSDADAVMVSHPLPPGTDVVSVTAAPDGARAVYVTSGPGNLVEWWSVPVTGPADAAVRLDTWTPADPGAGLATISPDGQTVAMIRSPAVGAPEVRRVAVGGGTPEPVAVPAPYTDYGAATWAPGGELVLAGLQSDPYEFHLFVQPSAGAPLTHLGEFAGEALEFDHTGALVDVVSGELLEVVPLDGSARRPIPFDAGGSNAALLDVTSDGAWAIVVTLRPTGPPPWTDGIALVPLTGVGGDVPRIPLVGVGEFFFPSTSPAGHWVALSYDRDADGDAVAEDGPTFALPIPPAAPRDVTVVPGDGAVEVSWDVPLGTRPISGWTVTAVPDDGGAPVVETAAGGARSATVTGLRNGHHYDVEVAARNHAGTGPASATTALPLAGGVQRVRGDDRVATAAAVSARSFDPGVPVAYVATAASFPDALAGGPAAVRDGGPILLTARDALSAATQAELERLAPDRIVVLGGAAAVADTVIAELGGLTAGTVRRLEGADRYATSAAIAQTYDAADTVYLTTGQNFPDALAGAALAARTNSPVLLTAADRLPDPVKAELERLSPKRIVILGGTKAVSQSVAGQATLLTDTVERIEGPDRYATAAAIADRFPAPTDVVYVATGTNFPDALAGAPAAALTGSPVVLVAPTDVPTSAAAALQRLSPREIVVLGGLAAVSAETADGLAGYLR